MRPPCSGFVGGTDPDRYAKAKEAGRLNEIPTNYNPRFAPVIHPTLQTGVEALIVAARLAGAIGQPIGPVRDCGPPDGAFAWCMTKAEPVSGSPARNQVSPFGLR